MSQTKWLSVFLFGFCVGMSGCIPIGYVIPEYHQLPAKVCQECDSDCTIVQFEQRESSGSYWISQAVIQLQQIKPDKASRQSLGQLSFNKGFHLWPFYSRHSSEQIAFRLYRRGFKTVELNKWPWSTEIRWLSAKTLEEKEIAIDDVWNCPYSKRNGDGDSVRWESDWSENPDSTLPRISSLYFSSFTPESATTLQWLANEYDELKKHIMTPPTSESEKKLFRRLTNKAHYCRGQAAQLQNK